MQKKQKLVVANWKMNPSGPDEAKEIFSATKRVAKELRRVMVVVCPPFLYLSGLKTSPKDRHLALGVQDVFSEVSGSYTGEISVHMIKNSGARFVIIGHSERRALGESDEIVAKKVAQTLEWGVTAILCVGEKNRDQNGDYFGFIKNQLLTSLLSIKKKDLGKLVVAYEPVWAIGKSFKEAMQPRDVHEMSIFIRKVLSDFYGKEWVGKVPILYGGSVNFENAKTIVEDGEVDGLLIGRESLHPEDFKIILRSVDEI